MRPRAKCHPEREHAAKGMCHSCYSTWRYNNVPEYRERVLAASTARQRKYRKARAYILVHHDIPPLIEGVRKYPWHLTAKDDAALEACLLRRGLKRTWEGSSRHVFPMGGWRRAA